MTEEATNGDIRRTFLTRASILEILTTAIKHLEKRVYHGRYRDFNKEKEQDAKLRLLIESCKVYASILRDEELEKLEARISILEELSCQQSRR